MKLPLAQHKLSGVVAHLCILAGLRAREDTERPSGSFAPVSFTGSVKLGWPTRLRETPSEIRVCLGLDRSNEQ